jgi:recombination protein RecA
MPKSKAIQEAYDLINKSFGVGSIWTALETIPEIAVISTGALTLDRALGVGGLPKGRITEIYGPEATGKTTLALSIISNVQKEGGSAAYIDVEHAIDLAYAKAIGVDVTELLISQPDDAEQALEIAETLVRAGISCVVLDSVAMLVTQAEIKGEMSDFQVGSQARLMGKALRKLMAPIDKGNCVFILINQLRANIGGYNPEITPGGKSIKYMASVRIDLRKKEQIKDADQTIGIRVLAKVVKNKVAPPSTTAEFNITFGKGIDRLGSVVDAAVAASVMEKSGAWYKYKGAVVGQGMPDTVAKLGANPKLREEIERAI